MSVGELSSRETALQSFILNLMKLRTLDLHLQIKSIILISSLSLLHSLAECGKKDVSSDLVLARKVFGFF